MSTSASEPRGAEEPYVSPPSYIFSTYNDSARVNQLDSPFLRLPGELRNRIYDYYFSDAVAVVKDTSGHSEKEKRFKQHFPNTRPLALLEACRQICHEASPLFWNLATIGVQANTHVRAIGKLLMMPKCTLITSLCIGSQASGWHWIFDEMGSRSPITTIITIFKSLKSVRILAPRIADRETARWAMGMVVQSGFQDDNLEVSLLEG